MKQVFGAVYYRLFHAKSFWLCCLSAAGAGVLSLFVLAVLRDYIAQLPREVLQPLYTGGYYDLGVVKLADLGALQSPSAGMILGSAFRGSTLTMLVVAFTTFFAGACLRGVYFRGCVAAGISRARAYVGVVAAVDRKSVV